MAAVVQPQGSPAALGLVNVGAPDPVEQDKVSAFRDSQINGGPAQDLVNVGAGLQAHLAATVAADGVGIHINAAG